MKKNNSIRKSLFVAIMVSFAALLLCPTFVQAKPTKTVKIYDFSSGNQKVDQKVKAIIRKEIKPEMTDSQKVKVIHDYIVLNCKYDYKNYKKGTIPWKSYSPEGVILNKKGVCQGYAETFSLFMKALNIPCKLVTGKANNGLDDEYPSASSDFIVFDKSYGGYQPHAWNLVKLNGKWYHVDTTWDDPVPDVKGRVMYSYFLIPDKQMAKDHKWTRSSYPKSGTNNDAFVKLIGKVSKDENDAADKLYNYFSKNSSGEVQIIVSKKKFKKTDIAKERICEQVKQKYWKSVASLAYSYCEYGNYIILTFKNVKLEDVIMTDCVYCHKPIPYFLDICPYCGQDRSKFSFFDE